MTRRESRARESFEAYRTRILGYLGRRDPLAVMRRTPAVLERRLATLPRTLVRRRPAPGQWSIVEIVAHLADAELAFGWRIRHVLATSGAALPWFDQDRWARRHRYAASDPRRSLALFRALRESHVTLLRAVPRGQWRSRYGLHAVRGRQTLLEFVTLEAAHDLNHLRQIDGIAAGGARRRNA